MNIKQNTNQDKQLRTKENGDLEYLILSEIINMIKKYICDDEHTRYRNNRDKYKNYHAHTYEYELCDRVGQMKHELMESCVYNSRYAKYIHCYINIQCVICNKEICYECEKECVQQYCDLPVCKQCTCLCKKCEKIMCCVCAEWVKQITS